MSPVAPTLAGSARALLARDLQLLWRRRGDAAQPALFALLVVVLFALALGNEAALLARVAPGVLWVAVVLSGLLALDTLFRGDAEDGSLEQWMLSPLPLAWLVLVRVATHWATTALPLVLAMPLLAELTARTWDDGYESFPPTSLQVSNIHAGTGANNVIPGELQVLFNLRYNPHWTADRLIEAIEAMCLRHGLDHALSWHRSGEPFHTPEGPLRAAAREVLATFAGAAPEESTGGGTSDARFIAPLGAQCIEIGPVNASIHKVDEHVRVADLEALPGLYLAIIERLLAANAGV